MATSSFDLQQIQERLARNRAAGAYGRKVVEVLAQSTDALDSLPCDRLAQGLDEPSVNAVLEQEIKNLHEPFEKWLRFNQHELQWIHSRPDKPATISVSVPDFVVIGGGGFSCQIEFKARKEPEAWKPREAGQKEWAAKARYLDIPYLCTNDLRAAIEHVKYHVLEAK